MKDFFELQNLEFSYAFGGNSVFAPVSFSLPAGESLGITGDNGSGKSTLLKVAASLIQPTRGRVIFQGQDVTVNLRAYRRIVNYSAGAPMGFYPRLSGIENLQFFSAMKGRMIGESEAISLISRVDLAESAARKKYHQYSLGMKQRLHIARLFMEPSELLILDEPTNGLSLEGISLFVEILQADLAAKAKLIVSHDDEFLKKVTSRILPIRASRGAVGEQTV